MNNPRRPPSPAALMVLAILGLWLLFPVLLHGQYAEDAAPFVAAGKLVGTDPGSVYVEPTSSGWRLRPPFAAALCATTEDQDACRRFALPFISPPLALGAARGVALLGDAGAILAFRAVGALGFVAGVGLLWRRRSPPTRDHELRLVLLGLLLTPFVFNTVAFGQTSSLLFLLACLVVPLTRRGAPATGATLAVTAAAKGFPLLLVPVLAAQRRWRSLAFAGGALVALAGLSALVGGAHLVDDYLASSRAVADSGIAVDHDVSLDGLARLFAPAFRTLSLGGALYLAARVLAVAVLYGMKVRHLDQARQRAFAGATVLVVLPQVWWHYGGLAVGVLAAATWDRRDGHRWWAPAGAALCVILALPTDHVTQVIAATVLSVATLLVTALVPIGGGEPLTSPSAVESRKEPGGARRLG